MEKPKVQKQPEQRILGKHSSSTKHEKKSVQKQRKTVDSTPVQQFIQQDSHTARHQDAIGELDNEIEHLERKLGVKGDKKRLGKIQKSIENEGMGKGFLDFLDGIPEVVRR